MFNNLEILGLAQARARHAAARQAQVATNIANADTPGYRARDVASFDQVFRIDGGSARRGAARPFPRAHGLSLGDERDARRTWPVEGA